LSRGYGSVGAASTDKIDTGQTSSTTLMSLFIRSYRISDGFGHSFGTMIDKRTDNATNREISLVNRGDIPDYDFLHGWSGITATWRFTRPAINVWSAIGVTYDNGSTTNDPVIYVDGTSVTVTQIGAEPSGTVITTAAPVLLGNRDDSTRAWDGYLADYGRWDRILSADEMKALGKGYSPLFFRRGLIAYSPLFGRHSPEPDWIGAGSGTLTGTANGSHPLVLLPNKGTRSAAAESAAVLSGGTRRPLLPRTFMRSRDSRWPHRVRT